MFWTNIFRKGKKQERTPQQSPLDQSIKELLDMKMEYHIQQEFRVTRFDEYDAVLRALLDSIPGAKEHPAVVAFKERHKAYEAAKQKTEESTRDGVR